MSTGQWIRPAGGVAWFFEAGAESLDFAYTGDMGRGEPVAERLHTPPSWARGSPNTWAASVPTT